MADKIIMLACSAGMSTSLLVSKCKQQLKNKARITKFSQSPLLISIINSEVEKPDVLMLGPQVAYMKNDIQNKCDDAGVPMEVINMTDYGMMNGKNVLAEAERSWVSPEAASA